MKIVNVIKDSFQECLPFNHALVLFSFGCNLSCSMCKGYNYENVIESGNIIGTAVDLIKSNITPLHDSVVFLGGEPTIHRGKLVTTLQYCKDRGLKTKIFTNGMLPDIVGEINDRRLCDAWSVDFKGINNFRKELGCKDGYSYIHNFGDTISNIQQACLPLEIRTTFYEGNAEDRKQIVEYAEGTIALYKQLNSNVYAKYIQQEDFRGHLNNA